MRKRRQIIDELIKRLEDNFEDPVKRGVVSIDENELPAIFIYEDIEEVEKKQWNNYICSLPLQIDYYITDYVEPYITGNEIIEKIMDAIEIENDRTFNDLVIDYGVTAKFIDIMVAPYLKVSVVYTFIYNEFFGKKE